MHFLTQPNILIARVIGIIAIAAGFLLGIEGLNQPDSIWLPIALALIVTGLCAPGVRVLPNHYAQDAVAE